jgi:hypothetical protein
MGTPGDGELEKVWRYMSFSRFVWLLQNKQLWLSRADLLGDPWEIALAGNQLEHVIARHPPTTLPLPDAPPETALERSKKIIELWRRTTFVSCWSASDYESHALWRIYCRSSEGVALQTTFARLRDSVHPVSLHRVIYQAPGIDRRTPTRSDLITKKRRMFAYENEIRVVHECDVEATGYSLAWNPEKNVETIHVHPGADNSFMDTVARTVTYYAPALKEACRLVRDEGEAAVLVCHTLRKAVEMRVCKKGTGHFHLD